MTYKIINSPEKAVGYMNVTVGKKIRSMRQSKSINQSDLAKTAGIAQSTLSYIENGRKSPQFHTLSAICRALDVSMLELLTYNEPDVGFKLFEQSAAWQNAMANNRSENNASSLFELLAGADADIGMLEHYLFDKYIQMENTPG